MACGVDVGKAMLTLDPSRSTALETRRYQSLDRWTSQLVSIQNQLLSKAAQAGSDRNGPGGGAGGAMGMGMGGWQDVSPQVF